MRNRDQTADRNRLPGQPAVLAVSRRFLLLPFLCRVRQAGRMQTQSRASRPNRRPNVVWVIADRLRAHSFGYRGDANARTLTTDNLARRGLRFDAAVFGTPWSTPFRASPLTS